MAGDGPVLPVVPDVRAAPPISDQPIVEPIRTAEKAGGGKKIKGGGRQERNKDPHRADAHRYQAADDQEPSQKRRGSFAAFWRAPHGAEVSSYHPPTRGAMRISSSFSLRMDSLLPL